ncbi:leucine-rich repeat-containing protein 2-like protein [Willisornis vidua]|uniref:Leucine-rich repeat-containing protein 2-like protein n=1 Tax=Willisornis vidua TaxID=1566151 RepID=A0ABQ9CPG9_9PASS|nr:leucine-rich repeat-containing protein 2-like protein [Willisornis vidua]
MKSGKLLTETNIDRIYSIKTLLEPFQTQEKTQEKLNVGNMGHQVIIFDFSVIRGLWETRVKKNKERQRKEKERLEKSALEKIKQEWNLILECRKKGIPQSKYLKNGFVDTSENNLDTYGDNSQLQKRHTLLDEVKKERNKFIFHLSGEQWMQEVCSAPHPVVLSPAACGPSFMLEKEEKEEEEAV